MSFKKGKRLSSHEEKPAANQKNIKIGLAHVKNERWHPEEQRHRGREWWFWRLSIVFSFVAMIGAIAAAGFTGSSVNAGWKAVELSRKALIEDDRAWVGPIDAGISGQIAAGQTLSGTVNYENFGKEPATNVAMALSVDGVATRKWYSSDKDNGAARIKIFIKQCLGVPASNDSMVVFPTTNFQTINVSIVDGEPKAPFDSVNFTDLADGKQMLVLGICFAYTTFGITKHTAGCYFYQAPHSNMAHLNICPTAYAD